LPKREISLFPTQPYGVKEKDSKHYRIGHSRNNSNDDDGNGVGEEDQEDDREDEQDENGDIRRILAAVEALFTSAYALVSNWSPTRKMTQQRAQILSDFAWGVGKKVKDRAFRCFKNPSSLADYLRTMKQLLVYYYRVVYREGGHFTRPREGDDREGPHSDGKVPRDIIKPTDEQHQAMKEIFRALREEDSARRVSSPPAVALGVDKVSETETTRPLRLETVRSVGSISASFVTRLAACLCGRQ
jgi:hypothetical protein